MRCTHTKREGCSTRVRITHPPGNEARHLVNSAFSIRVMRLDDDDGLEVQGVITRKRMNLFIQGTAECYTEDAVQRSHSSHSLYLSGLCTYVF